MCVKVLLRHLLLASLKTTINCTPHLPCRKFFLNSIDYAYCKYTKKIDKNKTYNKTYMLTYS